MPVSTIMKVLPKTSRSRRPSPSHRGQGSLEFSVDDPHHHQEMHLHDEPSVQHHEVHMHDDRVKTMNIGVDPIDDGPSVKHSACQRNLSPKQGH